MTRRKKWLVALFIVIIVGLPLGGYICYELGEARTECLDIKRPDRTPDRAIRACSIAIKIEPKRSLLYSRRGTEYIIKDQNNLAIKDLDQAIELDPKNLTSYVGRGLAYIHLGNYDSAQKDLEYALKLFPPDSSELTYKANLLGLLEEDAFLKNDFAYAEQINQQFRTLKPTSNEGVNWMHIYRMRAGQDDKQEFEQNSKALAPSPWQTAIAAFFTGKISADELINKASNPDPKMQKQQICEANFYIAESLMVTDKAKAVPYFQTADQVCSPFLKFAAHAALDQMKGQ